MKIVGLEGLSNAQLDAELKQGARFITYQYCISIIILTFRRSSNVYFVKPQESATLNGLGFSLLSFVFGWWGIPWGPIYTVQALWVNFRGGRDVTGNVLRALVAGSEPENPADAPEHPDS